MEKKRSKLLPSPAMIVAVVALIVALVGTAFASGVLTKKKVNNIISNRAPGLSVSHAKSADSAAPSGPAAGDLTGTYPNPTVNAGAIGTANFGTIPAVRVHNVADQSIPTGSTTDIAFDQERYDTAGMHNPASNTLLTAPVSGIYLVTGQVLWGANATGLRDLAVFRLSSGVISESESMPGSAAFNPSTQVQTVVRLAAGDSVKLEAFQASGGSLNILSEGATTHDRTPVFTMNWLAPGP